MKIAEDLKKLKLIDREPAISIGLMTGVWEVKFELKGRFAAADGARFSAGSYLATIDAGGIAIYDSTGNRTSLAPEFHLIPSDPASSFVVHDVPIGIDFHWERKEAEEFQGSLRLK